jgi:O-antigen ligase
MTQINRQVFGRQRLKFARPQLLDSIAASDARLALFFAAHIVLGLLMDKSVLLANIHAYVTLAVALWLAISKKPVEYIYYAAAYIVGSEVLWRMTEVTIFWEIGKYSVCVLLLIGIKRFNINRIPRMLLLYFLLLLPSSIFTITNKNNFYGDLSFNLSGPLLLLLSAWFFKQQHLNTSQLRKVALLVIMPTISITAISTSAMLSLTTIVFIDDSNHRMTGGFGPNQVSNALGLGILMLWILITVFSTRRTTQIIYGITAAWLVMQAALSFSRSGLFTTLLAAVAFSIPLLMLHKRRGRIFLLILLTILIVATVLVPVLAEYTNGAIIKRFSDLNLTGRDMIVLDDWQSFLENPIWGLGPGMGATHRIIVRAEVTAHIEYTRMLAEHGLLGLVALILLIGMAVQNAFRSGQSTVERGVVNALLVWSMVYFGHTAMRTAAGSFLFGMSFATFALGDDLGALARAMIAPIRVTLRSARRSAEY